MKMPFGHCDVTSTHNVSQEITDGLEPEEYYCSEFEPTDEYKAKYRGNLKHLPPIHHTNRETSF